MTATTRAAKADMYSINEGLPDIASGLVKRSSNLGELMAVSENVRQRDGEP